MHLGMGICDRDEAKDETRSGGMTLVVESAQGRTSDVTPERRGDSEKSKGICGA